MRTTLLFFRGARLHITPAFAADAVPEKIAFFADRQPLPHRFFVGFQIFRQRVKISGNRVIQRLSVF